MSSDVLDTLIQRDLPAAQGGDRNAYARLVGATQRMVASVALAITRDVALSEDIAQETFLTAWQRLDLMRNPASFLPWLRQVARNRALDHVRTLRYRETSADPFEPLLAEAAEGVPGPAETLGHEQDAALLAQALDEIPEESREVLLLFYREGQSSLDVAALLGLSDAAVRKRLQRARDNLREEWLRRIGDAAARSAPGAGFTSMVIAAMAMRPELAAAATATTGALVKAGSSKALLLLGSLGASIAVAVGAVWFETRKYLRRVRGADDRRALRHNGYVYAALMGTYMIVLFWGAYADWPDWQFLAVGGGISVGIIVLALQRRAILRRAGVRSCGRASAPESG